MCGRDEKLWLNVTTHWRIMIAYACQGYWHSLLIRRYEHQRYQGSLLMASYIGMYTISQKGIKTRMETTVDLYNKGNEIISWQLLYIGSCLVLNGNCFYIHYSRWNTLHQICTNQINNDNIHRGSKIVFGDDNIHPFPYMTKKRWEASHYTWAPLSNTIVATISWSVSWVVVHSLSHKQLNKWIPKSSMLYDHTNIMNTSRNHVVSNHSLCKYMQLNVAYNYKWLLMQLFFKFGWILVILQLVATMTYFIFPIGWFFILFLYFLQHCIYILNTCNQSSHIIVA